MAAPAPNEARIATKTGDEDDADSPAQVHDQHGPSTEAEPDAPEMESNPHAMHGFKLFAIFVGICFGAFLMSLDIFVIATVLLPIPRVISRKFNQKLSDPPDRPSHLSHLTFTIRHN